MSALQDKHTEPHWDRCALITIDVQNDFLDDGCYAVPGTTPLLPRIRTLLDGFRRNHCPIFHAVRLYLPDGSNADPVRRALLEDGHRFATPGTTGAELAAEMFAEPPSLDAARLLTGHRQHIDARERIFFKPRWSAFFCTGLAEELHDDAIDTLVIAGCNFPNCPRATCFDATQHDLRVVLAVDALSAFDGTHAIEMARIGARSAPTDEIVQAIEKARTGA